MSLRGCFRTFVRSLARAYATTPNDYPKKVHKSQSNYTFVYYLEGVLVLPAPLMLLLLLLSLLVLQDKHQITVLIPLSCSQNSLDTMETLHFFIRKTDEQLHNVLYSMMIRKKNRNV